MPKSQDIEKKILEAAETIFAQRGFHKATVAEIAQKAKVGEATIYNYFNNKEELLVQIPLERTKEAVHLLGEHLKGINGGLNKLRKIVWFFFQYWETHPNFSLIIQLMWRVNREYFHVDPEDWRHKLLSYIPQAIREGQEEGVVDPSLSVRLCRDLILGVMEGMLTRWLLRRSEWSLTDNADQVSDIIIRAIRKIPDQDGVFHLNIENVNVFLGNKGEDDES